MFVLLMNGVPVDQCSMFSSATTPARDPQTINIFLTNPLSLSLSLAKSALQIYGNRCSYIPNEMRHHDGKMGAPPAP